MRRNIHSINNPIRLITAIVKRITYIFKYKYIYLISPKIGAVHFYPEAPHPYTVAYKALHLNGIKIIHALPQNLQSAFTLFSWEDSTFSQKLIPNSLKTGFIANRNCVDISKTKVGIIHSTVFGYQVEINPLTFSGMMVAKSDENGTHSGEIVLGPISSVKLGRVYQQVINNTSDALELFSAGKNMAVDFRIPVFNTVQSHAYIKYRPLASRFTNTNDKVEFINIELLFNLHEIQQINNFCQEIGLDYGEIDVIRNGKFGLIYVLDVNKTPLGPPNGLSPSSFQKALDFYKEAFASFIFHTEK